MLFWGKQNRSQSLTFLDAYFWQWWYDTCCCKLKLQTQKSNVNFYSINWVGIKMIFIEIVYVLMELKIWFLVYYLSFVVKKLLFYLMFLQIIFIEIVCLLMKLRNWFLVYYLFFVLKKWWFNLMFLDSTLKAKQKINEKQAE